MCCADPIAFFEAETVLGLWANGSFLDEPTVGCKGLDGLEGREREKERAYSYVPRELCFETAGEAQRGRGGRRTLPSNKSTN